MNEVGSHTRDHLRQAYSDAWRKQVAGAPLTPLEAMIADVIGLHPEYQAMLQDTEAALDFEPNAAGAQENPFLHMGLLGETLWEAQRSGRAPDEGDYLKLARARLAAGFAK